MEAEAEAEAKKIIVMEAEAVQKLGASTSLLIRKLGNSIDQLYCIIDRVSVNIIILFQ